MYDPSVGRWLEEDPTGFAAGDANLGRYVGNNPTNAIDPSGLEEKPPALIYGGLPATGGGPKPPEPPTPYPSYQGFPPERDKEKVLDTTLNKLIPSRDGSNGFAIHIHGGKLKSIKVSSKEGTSNNDARTNFLILVATNGAIANFISGKLSKPDVDFESLPKGTVVDEGLKHRIGKTRVILRLKDQIIYDRLPDGTPYEVKVSGEIEIYVDDGWIAPSVKSDFKEEKEPPINPKLYRPSPPYLQGGPRGGSWVWVSTGPLPGEGYWEWK
jgi:hypothetical protein